MIRHIFTLIKNQIGKNVLLVVEVFFAFIILFAVLTFVFFNLKQFKTPLGFETSDLWVSNIAFETQDSLEVIRIKENVIAEVEAMPDVDNVAFSYHMSPFGGSNWAFGHSENGFNVFCFQFFVDMNFKETTDLDVISGRWFNESDFDARYPATLITKKTWEQYFNRQPVIDSVFIMDNGEENKIIGIVDYFRYRGQFTPDDGLSFNLIKIEDETVANIYIETNDAIQPDFEERLNNILRTTGEQDNFIIENIERRRVNANKATWVPIVALLVICSFLILNVALGLFGVLWYNISKRKAEIGLRRTLGAYKSNISWQFMGELIFLTGIGLLAGIIIAAQVPLLSLIEIENEYFIRAIVYSTLFILLLVTICVLYPSRQAAMLEPAEVLHEE